MERKETSKKKREERKERSLRKPPSPRAIKFACPDGIRMEILRERIARPLFSHSCHHPEKPVRNCIVERHKMVTDKMLLGLLVE